MHIDTLESNVAIVRNSMCTEDEKKHNGLSLGGSINFTQCHHLFDALLIETYPTKETLDQELSTYEKICCPCIGTATNTNLSSPQKELLLWRWKLGIRM